MIQTILYFHGFASSSESSKAQIIKKYISSNYKDIKIYTPDLSNDFKEAVQQIENLVMQNKNIAFMGCSLGGYYALYFSQLHRSKAILINPDESSYDITFKTIHKTKHTLIVEAKQKSLKNDFNNFILRIQISLDAKLAEVLSYQGEKAVPFFIYISDTQSKDEKLQQNRFFTEWLESIFISGINSEIKI